MSAVNAKGFHTLTTRQLVGTVIGLQLTLLLAALDQTIVSTAMPKIIAHLGGFSRYTWVTTAYMLSSTIAVPIFGKLSDLYGRKWLLIGAAILFVLTSALCGMAGEIPWLIGDGMTQLIVFRAIQGIAGGSIMALAFTVIGDIFPPAERGKYQGLFSAVFALSSIVGPALGGWITDYSSWRWVFFVNLPVGAVAVLVLLFAFPYFKPERENHPVDYAGILLLIGFLVPLLLALSWAPEIGWLAAPIIGMLALSAVLFGAFLFCEKHTRDPIIPLALFANQNISIACSSLFILSLAMFGSILFVPLYMQSVLGLSATQSGSMLTPMMLAMTSASFISGQLVSRLGHYKRIALVGLSLVTCGLFMLATLGISTSQVQVVANVILVGAGLGLLMPIYTLIVQNSAPINMMGVATSTAQFLRSVGGTVGAAVFGSIVIGRYHHYLSTAHIPQPIMTLLKDPLQVNRIIASVNSMSGVNVHTVIAQIKEAFVYAIGYAFLIAAIVVASALIMNLLLKDTPLRKSNKHPEPEPSTAAPVPALE